MTRLPKVTLVTPTLNSEKYLETTILSVLNQSYPNIEYIVIDGMSTDGTGAIIEKYRDRLAYSESSKDATMYEAINKGFRHATGDILAWINSDDILFPWSVASVVKHMNETGAQWVTGIPCNLSPEGLVYQVVFHPYYRRRWIQKGYYHRWGLGFIQQESTFWSRDLWERAGSKVPDQYRYAGDFHLWRKFARFEELHCLQTILGAFRIHGTQLTSNWQGYHKEVRAFDTFFTRLLGALRIHFLYSLAMRLLNIRKIFHVGLKSGS